MTRSERVLPLGLLGLALACSGCATMSARPMAADEAAYMEKAVKTPKEIELPAKQADEAWERAERFMSQHADKKPEVVTDEKITTSNPEPGKIVFNATKTTAGDTVKIKAVCDYEIPFGDDGRTANRAYLNANALRYFILTGEEPPPNLLKDFVAVSPDTATVQGAAVPAAVAAAPPVSCPFTYSPDKSSKIMLKSGRKVTGKIAHCDSRLSVRSGLMYYTFDISDVQSVEPNP